MRYVCDNKRQQQNKAKPSKVKQKKTHGAIMKYA